MIEHKLKLKFDDSFNGVLFSTQGDTGRVFEIEVRDELDNAIDITGHKLEFYVGNDSKVTKVEASISGNKFIVKPVNEQFTKSGLNKAQFVLYDPQGLQVGSQIFDLHVEESIQQGATVGANVLVDFSDIKEAIKLIKGYEKTFEENKNINADFSSHIEESKKVNQELVSNTSAAKGVDANLKTSTTSASETYTQLEASRTNADTLNNDLKANIAQGNKTNANLQSSISTANNTQNTLQEKTAQGLEVNKSLGQSIKTGQGIVSSINTADKGLADKIATADTSKTNLDKSINTANKSKADLDKSKAQADSVKIALDSSNSTATTNKAALDESIGKAEAAKSNLDASKAQADSTKTALDKSIKTGQDVNKASATNKLNLDQSIKDAKDAKAQLDESTGKANTAKTNLDASVSKAETTKTNLDTSTSQGNATDTKLKDTDTKASTSISTLQDLLNQSATTEQNLKDVIASGNLDKYLTESKLQEALSKIKTLKKEVVDTLPQTGQDDIIYLVKDSKGKANNVYLEYLWINNAFELIGSTEVDLSGYAKTEDLKDYAKKSDIRSEAKFKTMTAVIDQANSNPLTCATYEDDAKLIEKGSKAWDEFFGTKLVLFKDGKEVRELKDEELNSLSPDDGDVMAKFSRKGLNIKTVDNKVYVSMTDNPNNADFKYYAHSRGEEAKDSFYLGAYLGYEQNGKLRSIKGVMPTGIKTIGDFRTIAQANGKGYEQLAFYQWTFLQAMYILKYGNLNSQAALGKGVTGGSEFKNTGYTNGKGINYGTNNSMEPMRFQYVEDMWGNKFQWLDGVMSGENGTIQTNTDDFNNTANNYKSYSLGIKSNRYGYTSTVQGSNELGFIPKIANGSDSTYYSDYTYVSRAAARVAHAGGCYADGADAGAFYVDFGYGVDDAFATIGARLMFL